MGGVLERWFANVGAGGGHDAGPDRRARRTAGGGGGGGELPRGRRDRFRNGAGERPLHPGQVHLCDGRQPDRRFRLGAHAR